MKGGRKIIYCWLFAMHILSCLYSVFAIILLHVEYCGKLYLNPLLIYVLIVISILINYRVALAE